MTARWSNLPVRCRCSHGVSNHLRGSGRCYSTVCACQSYRDAAEVQGSQDRHPAGKARIPDHLRVEDINDYLRQKGELA
jgi:hypothetical protein